MCKACKMDPSEVAVKLQRQGAVEVEDFYMEVDYSPKKKRKATGKEKTRPGCPENDYKAHVYVWTIETEYRDFFYDYYGFPRTQSKVCVGCGKNNGSKPSDEYLKRKERAWAKLPVPEKGVPIPRRYIGWHGSPFKWWRWENLDEDYRAAKKEYVDRNGWPKYMYGF